MTKRLWIAVSFALAASLAFAAPKGTVARSAAIKYPAHTEQDGVAMGAVLLTSQETRTGFVSDLNHCCLVVEFALYPQKDHPIDLSSDDFSLRAVGNDTAVKASSAKVISATLQKKAAATRDVVVSPSVGVGYESGSVYDPTGQRRGSGVYTQSGVGVGIGSPGGQGGGTEADRSAMEVELSEKGLPEGLTSAPVAGYLYFPLSRKKNVRHQLEYTLNGNKVVLLLPE